MKEQKTLQESFIYKHVSMNSFESFENDNMNELIADVGVLAERTDPLLWQKVKEVLYYGYGYKTE